MVKIISDVIGISELQQIAENQFGDFVKIVVDIQKEILAVGGDLHADEEAMLLSQGSQQDDLWGINLYFNKSPDDRIEFDSMINVRPRQGNRSRSVESQEIQMKIRDIVGKMIS